MSRPVSPPVLLLLATLATAAVAPADVIHVPADVGTLQMAIGIAADGDIIELAAGTYNAPAGGFLIVNADKNFTIRAAANATVVLSGGTTDRVLRMENTGAGDYSVVFQGLTFADGFSATDGVGGGVTMIAATATFVDCDFTSNTSVAPTTGGGALFLFGGSEAHITDSSFTANTARNEGGALRLSGGRAHLHRTTFNANRTNIPNHRASAAGGAIHNTNAELWISDSRFVGNESGCIGGAVYVLGSFSDPVGCAAGAAGPCLPAAEAWIVNSTFIGNLTAADPSVTCTATPEGGAIHSENQAAIHIHNSRFEANNAGIGGAVSGYRTDQEITHSTFRGNFATAAGSSNFGGALETNSNDTAGDSTNWRPASLTIADSYFQGRFGATAVGAYKGGCIFARGDAPRTYGLNGVPQNGTAEVNRAPVTILRSVFADCDAGDDTTPGIGGALFLGHADLILESSMIIDSDAVGAQFPNGGGLVINTATLANVTDTTFAYNTAIDRGGAIVASGSTLNLSNCHLYENATVNGGAGSAIYSEPFTIGGNPLDADGMVAGNVFSNNPGLDFREFDNDGGPINCLVYDDNTLFPASGDVYVNPLTGARDLSGLNALVINRSAGDCSKSNVDNTALATQPELGAILAAPPHILAAHAVGDDPPSGETFIGYAWSAAAGTQVDLLGSPPPATSGVVTAGTGVHELHVGAQTFTTAVVDAAIPGAAFAASPPVIMDGGSSDLQWATTSGTFVDAAIDRRVANASTPSGSSTVSPAATRTYRLFLTTEEGGVVDAATVSVGGDPGLIFSDGFESGDTSAWSSTVP